MKRNKDGWRNSTPYYINFPISYFSRVESNGERLSVPSFQDVMNKVFYRGIAAEYRRTCNAWQNHEHYNGESLNQVLEKMGLSASWDAESLFYDHILPRMMETTLQQGEAFCGVPVDMLLRFAQEGQSDFECVQFLAYCAIRSILGSAWIEYVTPSVKRITWEHILSRMAGNIKRVPVEQLPPHIGYYISKRHRARLRKSLINKWHVQIDGQSRGKGGAYYMIGDSMPIAEAIAGAKQARAIKRKFQAQQAEFHDAGIQPP